MSTRGSIGFIYKDEYKSTYNHSDSYPDGLGQGCIDEIRKIKDWDKFIENYQKVKWVTGDYTPTVQEIDENRKWANQSVSTQKLEEMYVLLRELQGEVCINAIANGEVTLLLDSGDFIKDSLFCEYSYTLNLDTMMFEMYQGFQKSPQEANRFGQTADDGYYPCKKVMEFPFNNMPENWKDQFDNN